MHPRVCLHQVAMIAEPTAAFIEHCRDIGVAQMTLCTPLLMQPGGTDEALAALAPGGTHCHTVNHPMAMGRTLDTRRRGRDRGAVAGHRHRRRARCAQHLPGQRRAREAAAGKRPPRASPSCSRHASSRPGRRTCGCWSRPHRTSTPTCISPTPSTTPSASPRSPGSTSASNSPPAGSKAACARNSAAPCPIAGLVQISDYVLGDRATPNRAVPGDGMVPNEWLVRELLDAGYAGMFDLELVGPRIEAEGPRIASKRAAENLSELLTKLGA